MTLREAGIVGLEYLCQKPTSSFDYDYDPFDIPYCGVEAAQEYRLLSEDPAIMTKTTTSDDCMPDVVALTRGQEEHFYTHNIVGAFVTVICIAIAAGLFLGLMTLDILDLQIIVRSSNDDDEVLYATTLLPIVKNRHRLLVTLLLMDTLAYETLPIFLDQLMSGWVAVLLSTSLIVVFGEIFPSGIFTGPNQLYLGYRLAPVVKFFMAVLYPVAHPLGKLLDWLVDEDPEDQWYDREELSALVQIQHEQRTKHFAVPSTLKGRSRLTTAIKYQRNKDRQWNDLKTEIIEKVNERAETMDYDGDEEGALEQLTPPLHQREVDMVEGALSMKTRLAMDVYTPLKHVYAVPDDLILDRATITTIYSHGYSRVPVYRRNPHDEEDVSLYVGYLITRQLMLIDWADNRSIHTLPLTRPTCVSPRVNLVDLLRLLQTKGPLLTFVCARPDLANKALRQQGPIPVEAGLIGIISLVDIMESVLQDRIYDESDIRDRNNAVATLHRWAATKLQSFVRRRRRLLRSGSSQRNRMTSISPPPKRARTTSPRLTSNGSNDEGPFSPPDRDTEELTEETPLLESGANQTNSSGSNNGGAPPQKEAFYFV